MGRRQNEERKMTADSIQFHASPLEDDAPSETLFGARLGGASRTKLPHVTDLFEQSIIDVGLQKMGSPIAIRGMKQIEKVKPAVPVRSTEFTIGEINAFLDNQKDIDL